MSIIKNGEEIKKILDNDGVIAFVTDTVWGLGCLCDSEKAVKKIYNIKKREAQKPLILMSNDIQYLKPYVKTIPPIAQNLIDKHFPGALTLVLEKSDKTKSFITSGFNTVGIRIPNNEIFKEICSFAKDKVLATTSANLSHEPSAKTYEQALINMKDKADLIIKDYGYQAQGLESTVVLIQKNNYKILRQGQIIL